MEFDYHSWSVLLLVRTTPQFLVLIQVFIFFRNLEEFVFWHLLMATSSHMKITSLYSIWAQPLEMSGFLFFQKLFVSLLWTMPSSRTSSDTGKYLREVGKKENYLNVIGKWYCSGFCYPEFFLPAGYCVSVEQRPWPFVRPHVKKGKRGPDNLFSPIPFLCILLLWDQKAPNFQVPWPYAPHTSLPSALRLFCTSPNRNTTLIAWLLIDCLVLVVQQPTVYSYRTPSISAQLLQISAPLKYSPKSPTPGPSNPPTLPKIHLLHRS